MPAPMPAQQIPGQVKGHPLATQLQGSGDPRKLFSSADYRNFTLVDRISRKQPDYTEEQYGTVYPWVGQGDNPFPTHKLVYQEEEQDGEHVLRYYDSDWTQADQQPSNAVIGFSGDDADFPTYTRLYIIPRSIFTPLARLTALSGLSRATVTSGGSGYTQDSVATLSGGTGSGGVVKCFVNPDGELVDIQILTPGSWTVAPTVSVSIGHDAVATVDIQPQDCVLTKEEEVALQDQRVTSLYVGVRRFYETLPGPYLPSRDYDPKMGFVQARERAVAWANQQASVTATSIITYKARDGSAIVAWQIERIFTDGTGSSATNGLFPTGPGPIDYDDARGNVKSFSQTVQFVQEVYAASVVSSGAGGAPGTHTFLGTTGTGTKFQFTGTVNGTGNLTGALTITVNGNYTVRPTNLAAEPVTGGGVIGATVLLTMDASEDGLQTATNGIVTKISYRAIDEFHLERIIQYWAQTGPQLNGQEWDRRLDIATPFTRQLTAAGSNLGDDHTQIEPISLVQQQTTVWSASAIQAQLDVYHLASPTNVKGLRLPDVLKSVTLTYNSDTGTGSSDTTPTGAAAGGSISLSLSDHAHSQGSAAVTPELSHEQGHWDTGNEPPGVNHAFFVTDNATRAQVIAALSALLGRNVTSVVAGVVTTAPAGDGTVAHQLALNQIFKFSSVIGGSGGIAANTKYYVKAIPTSNTFTYSATSGGSALTGHAATSAVMTVPVNEMPIWYPQPHTFVGLGKRASVSADASAQQSVALRDSETSYVRVNGGGTSEEVGLTTRTWQLPPMIHGIITISDSGNPGTITATAEATATTDIDPNTNWPDGNTATESVSKDVAASVAPLSLTATTPAAWPTEGLYITEFAVEAYELERSHALIQVLDFATIPPP